MFVETEKRTQGEPQKVGTLKLSEAIRIGARIRPQVKFQMFRDGRSCALGAIVEGRGFKYDENSGHLVVRDVAPELWGNNDLNALGSSIFKMNDDGLPREEIADWLEAQGL